MADKPTKQPRWADVGGDIVEPTSGKKDVGWVSDEKPPAQWMNWWMNLVGEWFDFFTERFFDGASSGDFEVTAVDVATGTDQDGGDLDLSGGSSTGSGHSTASLNAAVAGASGAAVRAPAEFLKADGSIDRTVAAKQFNGIVSAPVAGNTIGAEGYGKGTGPGLRGEGESGNNADGVVGQGAGTSRGGYFLGEVGEDAIGAQGQGRGDKPGLFGASDDNGHGVQGNGGTNGGDGVAGAANGGNGNGLSGQGHGSGAGAYLTGGATGPGATIVADSVSPVRSCVRLGAQEPEASSPFKGDMQILTASGKLITHDGNVWNRIVSQVYANTSASTISPASATPQYFDRSFTIPAGTLRVGSTIRVMAGGDVISQNGSAVLELYLGIQIAARTLLVLPLYRRPESSRKFTLEGHAVMKAVGESADFLGSGLGIGAINTGMVIAPSSIIGVTTFNSNAAVPVQIGYYWNQSSASNQVRLNSLIVDVQ